VLCIEGKRRFGPCTWFAMAAHDGRLYGFHTDSMDDLPTGGGGAAETVPADEYVRRVVETVSKFPSKLKSSNDVRKMTKGRSADIRDALKTALRDGLLTESQDGTFCVGGSHL
jgi:hypothetical protein